MNILSWNHHMHFIMILVPIRCIHFWKCQQAQHFYESISWYLSDAGLLVLLWVYWYLLLIHVGNFNNLSKGRAISWILKTPISTFFKDIQCPWYQHFWTILYFPSHEVRSDLAGDILFGKWYFGTEGKRTSMLFQWDLQVLINMTWWIAQLTLWYKICQQDWP